VLFGEETTEYWEYYNHWTKMLLRSKAKRLTDGLEVMANNTGSTNNREALIGEVSFLELTLDWMDYHRCKQMRLPIGRGTVESACKNAIGGRMKLGGMTRSDYGADEMLQIRRFKESGRFLSDFRQLLAA
jgi:hypothetical protein